jgi:hypothetical protein
VGLRAGLEAVAKETPASFGIRSLAVQPLAYLVLSLWLTKNHAFKTVEESGQVDITAVRILNLAT